jgi:CO/xanthine dehydrogenase FAD-binding subunit
MKPAPFKYLRAETPEHAVELLQQHGDDARLLAGGQTLIPMMNLRLARAEIIIDIGRLPLEQITAARGSVTIGALARHRSVIGNREVAAATAIVPQAMRHIAHPTIRNHGTAGGSVAYADPTAEICALVMLLDGEINVLSAGGGRTIAAKDYFIGAFNTGLAADEMITGIHLRPPTVPHGCCFLELSEREGDYAIAAAGVTIVADGGVIKAARIVMSGAASVPVRAHAAEQALLGRMLNEKLAADAGVAAVDGQSCYEDIRASVAYRKDLLQCLVSRAVTAAYAQVSR